MGEDKSEEEHPQKRFSSNAPLPPIEPLLVDINKRAFYEVLNDRFGDDDEAKIRGLETVLEQALKGLIFMLEIRRKAAAEVLSELKLKQERLKP